MPISLSWGIDVPAMPLMDPIIKKGIWSYEIAELEHFFQL
jgi:hypothetical protein